MTRAIEHRYILNPETNGWRELRIEAMRIHQGFLFISNNKSLYVGLENANRASLCFRNENLGTPDIRFKVRIPRKIGNFLFWLCGKRILKRTRHQVIFENRTWRINEFTGDLRGLMLVEVELEKNETNIPQPSWALADVTMDSRFTFAHLAQYGIPSKKKNGYRV